MLKLKVTELLPGGAVVLGVLALLMPAVVTAGNALEATHALAIRLDPANAGLAGIDRITMPNLATASLQLHIGEAVVIESLRVNGTESAYRRQGRRVMVHLPAAAGSTPLILEVHYRGRFDDPAPNDPINTDNPGFGVSGTISPRGTLLLGGAGWYPSVAGAAEKFRIEVTAPAGIRSVTAGRALAVSERNGSTVSAWQIDQSSKQLALVAGRFTVREKRAGHLYAATYFLEDDPVLSDQYLQASLQYLAEYETLFGPYPFEKFAVVENFFPTGYGFPSYTLIGGRVLRLPFIIHTSLRHEIAHCWWGNGVQVDYERGNWSEGLTTYVADYRHREQSGHAAARDYRQQLLRNYTELAPPAKDFPLSRFSSRYDPLTKAVGYDKAAMVFHMLRQRVGDSVFWETLRRLTAERMFQTTSWRDIQAAFEAGCGFSLETFFQQWVQQKGAPQLALMQVARQPAAAGAIVRGRLDQPGSDFELEVPVRFKAGKFAYERTIAVRGAQTAFEITVPFMPARLEADPGGDILRRLDPREMPPTINRLKSARDLLVVVPDGPQGNPARRLAERLGLALGVENLKMAANSKLSSKRLPRQNMLVMLAQGDRNTAAIWNRWLAVGEDRFSFRELSFDRHNHTLVAVLPHPSQSDRFTAVYLFGQNEDRMRIATKVPHYGKYSYLVFEHARNVAKGTWPVTQSPLVYTWDEEPAG